MWRVTGDPWQVPLKPSRVQRAVGRRVAELREDRGLTQDDLAERVRMTTRYVRRLEAGEHAMTLATLVRLANALEVGVEALFARPARRRRAKRA